jgi:hypothetical protein
MSRSDEDPAPGSLVFTPPNKPVDLRNIANWGRFTFGADWRHPYGPKARSARPSSRLTPIY